MNSEKLKAEYDNIIVVSGTGRNTGKTTFICKLIEKFNEKGCIAVKISSHFHKLPDDVDFIADKKKYQIIQEKTAGTKDSQKMLKAGAQKVYYIQAKDDFLPEIIKQIHLNNSQPFIFESGAIAKYLPGALHICVAGDDIYKPCRQPHFTLRKEDESMDDFLANIQFENNKFIVYVNT